MEFLANAHLRAACILLVMCMHHVTSESCDIRIHARVVLPTGASCDCVQVDGTKDTLWLIPDGC